MNRRRTIAIAIIAGLVVLAVAAAAFLLNQPRTQTAAPVETSAPAPETTPAPTPTPTPTPTPDPPPTALNILLIGSDSRVNDRAVAASGGTSDQRGDALVFIHLPADRQNVYGISIMRDLWVDIPGYGAAKVNAGLELGGVPLMTQTVESLLGQTHRPHRDAGLPGLRRHDRRPRRRRRRHQAGLSGHRSTTSCIFRRG